MAHITNMDFCNTNFSEHLRSGGAKHGSRALSGARMLV